MRSDSGRNLTLVAFVLLVLFGANHGQAQWSAVPDSTVRNAFGPNSATRANPCRGACGGGCPASCSRTVSFECVDDIRLRRIVRYDCGTHEACRVHDDCLDLCVQNSAGENSRECQSRCDSNIVEAHGPVSATAWLAGQGPYDGRIVFEYSRETPQSLEAEYQCPAGTTRRCGSTPGCAASNGENYDPLFAAYSQRGHDDMQVSGLRAGKVCEDHVCSYAVDIPVTGKDTCAGQRCTRFGVEFDYQGAVAGELLECRTSTLGEESDFINTLLKQGADSLTGRDAGSSQDSEAEATAPDGAAALLGLFGKVLAGGDSTEDVEVTITPLDSDGNPIVSQRVGSHVHAESAPVPRRVMLAASSGHLFIPMYQTVEGMASGLVKEKYIKCSHRGAPVLEATFRLRGM